jgi:aspartate aminotransferase
MFLAELHALPDCLGARKWRCLVPRRENDEHRLRRNSGSADAWSGLLIGNASQIGWTPARIFRSRQEYRPSMSSTLTATTYPLKLAKRMRGLGTELSFEMLVRARALEAKGRDIIHLEIGEPDFDTPANIVDAGIRALKSGLTHYSPSAGLPEMRRAVAEYVGRTRNVEVTPEEVVIVPGGKPIIFFVALALIDRWDEVIYPSPGHPIYESMIDFLDGRPVPVHLREEQGFRLDVNQLVDKITDRTRLIILNSPHNPTGGVLTKSDIRDIGAAIGDRNIMVLSDEIYSQLIFEEKHVSLMSTPRFRDRTILLDGFSKAYAMTGWRLGFGVMRADLAAQVARLMTNSNSCTASFTQIAGIEALLGDQSSVDQMREEFRRRRDVMVSGLNRIKGFQCQKPNGAFYVFPNVRDTGWRSDDLANALLDEAGVACLPGTAFGTFGEGYLRFSLANSVESIEKALNRIDEWVTTRL